MGEIPRDELWDRPAPRWVPWAFVGALGLFVVVGTVAAVRAGYL